MSLLGSKEMKLVIICAITGVAAIVASAIVSIVSDIKNIDYIHEASTNIKKANAKLERCEEILESLDKWRKYNGF
jgi:hypothetical protein